MARFRFNEYSDGLFQAVNLSERIFLGISNKQKCPIKLIVIREIQR